MRIRLTFLLWLLAVAGARAELVLGKPEWGFDGTAVSNAFNLLTIQVRNAGSQPFEGTLILDDGGRFGRGNSAPYLQQVFIAPGAARNVQFYPYLSSGFGDCRLTWREQGGGDVPIEAPAMGAPAVVLLFDPEGPNLRTIRMRGFNEVNFPPTAAATDALRAVVLDHQPKWDTPRREAFLDWVKRGGIVHVIHGADGTVPQFNNELTALNVAEPQGVVGAGLIVKHAIARSDLTPEFLQAAGFPAAEKSRDLPQRYNPGDSGIFRSLSQATKPNIAWGVIYTLTLVYVLLVGPVFYFLRKRDYRFLLGGFVGTVALFAWLFTVIGRRGYGEKQIYHKLALAREIDPGKWDVRHWVHAFATTGNTYQFSFAAPSQLYAAVSLEEEVRGKVLHGRESSFSADIPLFSSRGFLHHGVLSGPVLSWQLRAFEPSPERSSLRALRFKSPQGFQGEILSVVAQHREKFYCMENRQDHWVLSDKSPVSANDAFGADQQLDYGGYYDSAENTVARLRASAMPLSRLVIGDPDSPREALARPLLANQIRLFTYASAPDAFPITSAEFQAGLGLILFVQDFTTAVPSAP